MLQTIPLPIVPTIKEEDLVPQVPCATAVPYDSDSEGDYDWGDDFVASGICPKCSFVNSVWFGYDEYDDDNPKRHQALEVVASDSTLHTCSFCRQVSQFCIQEKVIVENGIVDDCTIHRTHESGRTRFDMSNISGRPSHLIVTDQSKGDSLLLYCGEVLIIYDTGYKKGFGSIKAELKLENIRIVLVIVSHDDVDHSAGFSRLVRYLSTRPGRQYKVYTVAEDRISRYSDHQIFSPGNQSYIQFTFTQMQAYLFFAHDDPVDPNQRSIVLVLHDDRDYLYCLTGDQLLLRINNILQQFLPKTELVLFQIPHHGSTRNYGADMLPKSRYYVISGGSAERVRLQETIKFTITKFHETGIKNPQWYMNLYEPNHRLELHFSF